MFKFFRKYNKYILAVGATMLMVAFLIQGTLDQLIGRNPTKIVIGHIADKKVVQRDVYKAGSQLDVLQSMIGGMVVDNPLQWLLMKREAISMGLSTSQYEVNSVLTAIGLTEAILVQRATQYRLPVAYLYQCLHEWVMVEHYKELMLGRTYQPVQEKINTFSYARQIASQGYPFVYVQRVLSRIGGNQRVSRPLVERFIHESDSTAGITALKISAARYAAQVTPPDEEKVKQLYEEFKSNLRDTGRYGFGYRFPNRVRLSYLHIPISLFRDQIKISETDALHYYDTNQSTFTPAPEEGSKSPPETLPYRLMRDQIRQRLREQRARNRAEEMIKAAKSILVDHNRALKTESGYRVLEVLQWQPLSLEALAERLQEQFEVLTPVYNLGDVWFTTEDLADIDGLGQANLTGRLTAPFVQYVLSCRELNPSDDNRLITLRLQKSLVGAPLTAPDGSRYLFRLKNVDAEHDPASLEEVRGRVELDAKRLAAYELLLQEHDQWLERARRQSFEDLAQELSVDLIKPPPFSRRSSNFLTGVLEVPIIAGIGQQEAFVDRVFEIAEKIGANPVDSVPAQDRIDAVTSDSDQSLIAFRVDSYSPITAVANKPANEQKMLLSLVTQSLVSANAASPWAMDVLSQRVGYEAEHETP